MDDQFGVRVRQARRAQGVSQADLAKAVGTSQQTINRIENTGVQSSRYVGPIAEFLGIDLDGGPAQLTAARPQPNASPPVPVQYPTERIPMMGMGSGGADGKFVLNGNKVMDALCPPQLVGVPNAYGVFVHGGSMEPRYHPGEAVFVNPHLPVRQSDYVVVQIADEDEGAEIAGFIKRFVSMNSRELVLEQYQPRDEVDENAPEAERFMLRFARERVFAVHKIVASGIV